MVPPMVGGVPFPQGLRKWKIEEALVITSWSPVRVKGSGILPWGRGHGEPWLTQESSVSQKDLAIVTHFGFASPPVHMEQEKGAKGGQAPEKLEPHSR